MCSIEGQLKLGSWLISAAKPPPDPTVLPPVFEKKGDLVEIRLHIVFLNTFTVLSATDRKDPSLEAASNNSRWFGGSVPPPKAPPPPRALNAEVRVCSCCCTTFYHVDCVIGICLQNEFKQAVGNKSIIGQVTSDLRKLLGCVELLTSCLEKHSFENVSLLHSLRFKSMSRSKQQKLKTAPLNGGGVSGVGTVLSRSDVGWSLPQNQYGPVSWPLREVMYYSVGAFGKPHFIM